MGNIHIRKLPDDVHQRLKQLAKRNNRSAEAEVRSIITTRVNDEIGQGLGSRLRKIWNTAPDDTLPEFERSTAQPREVKFK